jgi:sarcosine oxidase/L-pipecolate oxidase
MSSQPSYLIIGAGVFGVSTAYHLIKKYPDASIRLVDRTQYPCPLAASWDWNKVVRADYGDAFYMEKALEAIQLWRNDPLFSPYYHQCGMINIDNTSLGEETLQNYKDLGVEVNANMVSPEDFKKEFGSFYDDTDFSEVSEVFVNRDSGWAEATKALTAYTNAVVESGVKYTAADIDVLTFGAEGGCTGVLTRNGDNITADRVVLATGAGTAKLLADSAPGRSELQVDGRLVAGAVVTGIVNLDPKNGHQYTEIPVTVHSVLPTRGKATVTEHAALC